MKEIMEAKQADSAHEDEVIAQIDKSSRDLSMGKTLNIEALGAAAGKVDADIERLLGNRDAFVSYERDGAGKLTALTIVLKSEEGELAQALDNLGLLKEVLRNGSSAFRAYQEDPDARAIIDEAIDAMEARAKIHGMIYDMGHKKGNN